ncbi:MAG TPA: carboxypeptidase-like regulatory domain-containing protein [Gemmataceae bacterium]|jgi:hypothetical protein
MTAHRFCRAALLVLAATAAGGCSAKPYQDQRPKLVPVRGVVKYNGKPLDGARVTFTNTAAGISAYALTDAGGKFTLTTFEPGDGAAPGHYQIAVTKAQDVGHPTEKTAPPVFRSGGAPHPRWLIPQKYGNLATSNLSADVGESGNDDIVVELRGST